MSEPKKSILDDSDLSVTLTVGQLRTLVREEIEKAAGQNGHQTELLTAEKLAEKLKVPESWVYEQSRLGNIPTHKLGRYIRFDLTEVLRNQKEKKDSL